MTIIVVIVAIIVGSLGALSLIRIQTTRDPSEEEKADLEATQAYNLVSRWFLFDFFRFLEINRLKRYRPEGTLVDAGCGPGFIDLALAQKYPQLQIIGMDISPDMVEVARKNQASLKLQREVSFRVDDVENFSLTDNSADFIISSLSLHHWTDSNRALKEIFRVLKPGGQLLIFDLRRDEPLLVYYVGRFIQDLLAPDSIQRTNGGIGSIRSSYTPREMVSLLTTSPFHTWSVKKGWGWAFIEAKK